MVIVQIIGSPDCRRYQRMRQLVLSEAAHLNLHIQIDEVTQVEQLWQFNPISLPRLYINGQLVASQNPPSVKQIAKFLNQEQS
jgi:hypothetical protein